MNEAILKSRGAARVRSGHLWVYRSDIFEAAGKAGDVVRVADRGGKFLGYAFYNPKSEISLRIADRRDTPIDETWFADRINEAVAYRKTLNIDADACRLLHAEADGILGLVIDRVANKVQT